MIYKPRRIVSERPSSSVNGMPLNLQINNKRKKPNKQSYDFPGCIDEETPPVPIASMAPQSHSRSSSQHADYNKKTAPAMSEYRTITGPDVTIKTDTRMFSSRFTDPFKIGTIDEMDENMEQSSH